MIDPNKKINNAILTLHQQKTYEEIQAILNVGTHRISDVIHVGKSITKGEENQKLPQK